MTFLTSWLPPASAVYYMAILTNWRASLQAVPDGKSLLFLGEKSLRKKKK